MRTSYDFQIPGALRTGIELLRNRGTAVLGGRPRDGHLRVAGRYRLNEFGYLIEDCNYFAGARCRWGVRVCVDANTRQHRQLATQREAVKPEASARAVTRSRRTEAGPHAAVGPLFVNPKTESYPPQVGT